MERRMLGNWHVRCGAGEKLEITSKAYLLQTIVEDSINHKIPYVIYPVYNKLTYPVMYQCEIQTYAHQDQ